VDGLRTQSASLGAAMEGAGRPDMVGAAEMLLETVTPRRLVSPPALIPGLASFEVGPTVGTFETFFGKPKIFFNKKDNAANFAVQRVGPSVGVAPTLCTASWRWPEGLRAVPSVHRAVPSCPPPRHR